MTDDKRTTRGPGRLGIRCRAGTTHAAPTGAEEAELPAAQEPPGPHELPGLQIDVRTRGDAVVVAVRGEIDLNTADPLRERLRELDAEGHRWIVVDFTGVLFCDATGIGVLVAAHNRATEQGGAIAIAGVRPAQRRLLHITGLHRVFALHDTVEEAFAQDATADSPATSSSG